MEQTTIPGIPEKEPGQHYIPTRSGHKLTARQRAFARFYATSRNLTQSAIKAGYSPKNAHKIGHGLFHKTHVYELIVAEEEAILREAGVDRILVLREIGRLAHTDIRKLFNADGSLKNPDQWDDATAAAISSVEVTEQFDSSGKRKVSVGFLKKIKLWDKPSTLEKLGKYLKLWADRVEVEDLTLTNLQERLLKAKQMAHGTTENE
jgi:phage terminase small subunit